MRIGITFVAWQSEDMLARSLAPWITARATKLGGHEWSICAVCVPFEGFPQEEKRDRTAEILKLGIAMGDIDHVIAHEWAPDMGKPWKETDARGAALRWLRDEAKVDLHWQADADEYPTCDQLAAILRWVESNPYTDWFRLSLLNRVFTPDQHLAEPFTPPRIHRTKVRGYRAHSFHEDNGITYGGTITRDLIPDSQFASMTIPKEVAWIEHDSWPSTDRGKRKAIYQQRRWAPPNGAGCAFRWDEVTDRLVWNEEHFRLTGKPIPEVITT